MKLKLIKTLPDKSPVDEVKGTIQTVYPPKEPTDSDKQYGQHRQSLLIYDGEGEKLMVNLMKEQLHILDPSEGKEIIICSSVNEKGDARGVTFSTWQPEGKQYPNTSVKVYPEATIRLVPAGGSVEHSVPQNNPSPELPISQETAPAHYIQSVDTEFDKELILTAYAYGKCLDKASEVIAERPLLANDGEALRTIATNLWMSCKHKVATINQPTVNQPTTPAKKEVTPEPANPINKVKLLGNSTLITKCIAGNKASDSLDENGQAYLGLINEEVEERKMWEEVYDQLCIATFPEDKKSTNYIFDSTATMLGVKSPAVEKFLVCSQTTWRANVTEAKKEILGEELTTPNQ